MIAAAAASTEIAQACPSSLMLETVTISTPALRHIARIGSVSAGSASRATKTFFAFPADNALRSCLIPTTLFAVFNSSSTVFDTSGTARNLCSRKDEL